MSLRSVTFKKVGVKRDYNKLCSHRHDRKRPFCAPFVTAIATTTCCYCSNIHAYALMSFQAAFGDIEMLQAAASAAASRNVNRIESGDQLE